MINKQVGTQKYTNSLGWIYQEVKDVVCVFKKNSSHQYVLIDTLTPYELEELLKTRTVYPIWIHT